MRVFVTGATGFVGSAVVQELRQAGHQVLGLARSEASAAALVAAGVEVHRGDLEDLDSLRNGASSADAVIHTGFNHDFSRFKESCVADGLAIEAMGAALEGTGKPLIVTSGTGLLTKGGIATESTEPAYGPAVPRVSEQAALAFATRGVRVSIVRLPPSTHGDGDHGFVPLLIGIARNKGSAAYIGEGLNHWPAVHRFDAASLYRLVLENGTAGTRYHAVAEEGIPFRDIAAVIGRRLGLPVVSKSVEEAGEHFGWFTHFAGIDNRASSQKTCEDLGWQPTRPGLIEDLDRPVYFEA
ncbi:SDR family oxidoreductase [Pararhizobium sp.]|uniref:SDR family oxidoreductase n=1 Tax=Pararhizobium sp. TaxID=1977563 RepID=UPI00271C4E83|nr:SDR family oxidoreductase [Pararhizobium sp.]MDO9417291.1 SDR family oxidoreductase [Pararhizobium sp.]